MAHRRSSFCAATGRRPSALNWESGDFGTYALPLSLECDPFLYGTRQDIAATTLRNGVTGSPVATITATGIKGDAPTPAVVWTSTTAASMKVGMFGSTVKPQLVEAESGTMGANTATTSSSTFSNGSGALFTPVNSTAANRITNLTLPNTSPVPGSYKLMARVKKSVSGDTFKLFVNEADTTDTFTPAYSSTEFQVMELGFITLAGGSAGAAAPLQAPASYTISLNVQRSSGSGTLSIDWIGLMPADGDRGLGS